MRTITVVAKAMAEHHKAPNDWRDYLPLAAIAIQALRSPTTEMLEAVAPDLHPDRIGPTIALYETMMDAAVGTIDPVSKDQIASKMEHVMAALKRLQELANAR